jgi:hypothetical protein
MTMPLADYEVERRCIQTLFDAECRQRIVLVRGASGSGKTHLLQYCKEQMPAGMPHLPVQLRSRAVTIADIFYRAGGRLTWKHMNAFTKQVAGMQAVSMANVDHNWLLGINNHISLALHAPDLIDREQRAAALTEAWFEDLRALPRPLLMLFDTYEQATTDVQGWISGPFLARAAVTERVRVVIAGQDVPDRRNIEWGECCQELTLYGVHEAKHWLPVVQAMGRRVPVDPADTWLAGVCHALKGDPAVIMRVIEGLPLLGGTA